MAQGQIKKSKPTAAPRRPNKPGAKKGPRVFKSKKTSLAEKQKADKKFQAELTRGTEKALAERAGHLEMLRGGKKDKKKGQGSKSK